MKKRNRTNEIIIIILTITVCFLAIVTLGHCETARGAEVGSGPDMDRPDVGKSSTSPIALLISGLCGIVAGLLVAAEIITRYRRGGRS